MSLIFAYDTETTGKFDFKAPVDAPHQPHICQFAGILITPGKKVIHEFSCLIKPRGWELTQELTDIHGWTTQECEDHGIELEEFLSMFHMMQSRAVLKVGHNLGFDEKMLLRSGASLSEVPIFDTMHKSTAVCKLPKASGGGYKWPKLNEAHEVLLGKGFDGAHNAMADIRATLRIYFKLLEMGIV